MTRRILSVWLPHWPITRLTRSVSVSPDKPLVTIETIRGVRRLAAVGVHGEAQGLRPGQTLTDARAVCPGLVPVEADPVADEAALVRLAAWCERYTPMAAADPPDGLWLDITGCVHLARLRERSTRMARRERGHPGGSTLSRVANAPRPLPQAGEVYLAQDLATRLERNAIPHRLAVAGTTGAAWALAHAGEQPTILPSGEEMAALADLPITSLRLDPGTVAGLRRLGLRVVQDLLCIPPPQLTIRFGGLPILRLDQALGAMDEAIDWPRPPIDWFERIAFAEPIGTPDDLLRAVSRLAEQLCGRLADQHKGGQRFVARFFRVDDVVPQIGVNTALPVRDPAYLTKLLSEKLETIDPGFGIEVIALEAEIVAPLQTPQARLSDLASPETTDRLAGVVDMLTNRLGLEQVWRVMPHESHVPERAVQRTPPLPVRQPSWVSDPAAPRPIRLLRRPEPIEVIAPVPDDPPVRFSWRGVSHRVRAAAGPERIAAEWWRGRHSDKRPETDLIRDYYRVEDSDGARFWIYRAGLHGEERMPQWYLHGLFG